MPDQREERLRISDAAGEPKTFSENGYREAAMSDEKINGEDTSIPPSPEYQEFLDDLNQYSNPEVFKDASLPQIYKLQIINQSLPDIPAILDIEVNGEALPTILLEYVALMVKNNKDNAAKDLSEVRAELLADEEYLEAEQEMRRFFVRHLPKLIVRIYDISLLMAIFASAKQSASQSSMRNEFEQMIKQMLNAHTQILKREIKRMVGIRSRGRPKRLETDDLPEIINRVIDIACEIMGDARGKDAVPGLKSIAAKLGLTENALGKQLIRAGFSWTTIRDYIADLP
jgi:hypothetical protein